MVTQGTPRRLAEALNAEPALKVKDWGSWLVEVLNSGVYIIVDRWPVTIFEVLGFAWVWFEFLGASRAGPSFVLMLLLDSSS